MREGLEALLSEAGDLDAEVFLEIVPGFCRLRVRGYEMRFKRPEPGTARLEQSLRAGLQGLAFKWRSLIDMGEAGRRDLAPLVEAEDGCELPLDLPGPGVVYACRGGRLAVRPALVDRPPSLGYRPTPLQAAVLITEANLRNTGIKARLIEIAADAPDAEADLARIHALLAVPDGLPPTTFESLQELPSCPEVLIALVSTSTDEAMCERVLAA